jgi:hypothetical protein
VREIEVNVAYRWFLGLGLRDAVPDHSTISQNRRRRFDGTDVFRELFGDVVELAMEKGFVEGKALYTDSTHLKANANKHKYREKAVRRNARKYLDELDKAIGRDREAHGKKPLAPKAQEPEEHEIKQSTTDPESGFMTREGKPQGFYYLDHRTCNGRFNFITDVYVTPANIYDSLVCLGRLDHQRHRFGFPVEEVGLDAGRDGSGNRGSPMTASRTGIPVPLAGISRISPRTGTGTANMLPIPQSVYSARI